MLGKYARVKVVMPIGSTDGTGYRYPLNYGTVYGEKDQTAYIMGIHHPVRNFDGRVIAVLRNKKEKKSIWIVAPKSTRFIVNDIFEYLDPERDFPATGWNAFTRAAAARSSSMILRGRCATC